MVVQYIAASRYPMFTAATRNSGMTLPTPCSTHVKPNQSLSNLSCHPPNNQCSTDLMRRTAPLSRPDTSTSTSSTTPTHSTSPPPPPFPYASSVKTAEAVQPSHLLSHSKVLHAYHALLLFAGRGDAVLLCRPIADHAGGSGGGSRG